MGQIKLSKKQRDVAEMLANPNCKYNDTQIIAKCGVPRTTFYRWLRDDDNFNAYVDKLIDKYTDAELGAIWKALINQCKDGDTQAIKLYFELKGKYKQDIRVDGSALVQIIDNISGDDDDTG